MADTTDNKPSSIAVVPTKFEHEADRLTTRIQEFEADLAQAWFRVACEVFEGDDKSYGIRFARQGKQWSLSVLVKHRVGKANPFEPFTAREYEIRERPILDSSLADRARAVGLFEKLVQTMRECYDSLKQRLIVAHDEVGSAAGLLNELLKREGS